MIVNVLVIDAALHKKSKDLPHDVMSQNSLYNNSVFFVADKSSKTLGIIKGN